LAESTVRRGGCPYNANGGAYPAGDAEPESDNADGNPDNGLRDRAAVC
jgi:hypothetical protein